MGSKLDVILEATRERLGKARRERSLGDLEREAAAQPPPRGFERSLRTDGISLVAEVKRASPSAGDIRAGIDPASLAEAYEEGGAQAVSVLTEPVFFSGSLEDLIQARNATSVPVLRKDFTLDPYQVFEARAAGADAVLLIMAALRDRVLYAELAQAASEAGLGVLVEVHDERELDEAFEVEPRIIGINQRDLSTFQVDPGVAARLRPRVPEGIAVVAESGIRQRADVQALEEAGLDAILVGEALMRSADPRKAVAELLGIEGEQE